MADLGTVDDFTYTDIPVTVSTNNPTGYKLFLSMNSDETCLRHVTQTSDPCSSVSTYKKIAPVAPSTPASGFPVNNWGVAIDSSFVTFNPVPALSTSPLLVNNELNSIVDDIVYTRFASLIDLSIVSGIYTNTVTYTTIANPRPTPDIATQDPSIGSTGDLITFTGTNLDLIYQIYIGDVACDNLDVIDAFNATCEAPVNDLGTYDVTGLSIWGDLFNGDSFTYTEVFKFTIDTRMTDTLDTDPAHFDGVDTVFTIGTGGTYWWDNQFDWLIDWGDGSPVETATGSGTSGITHDYASTGGPGEYQITIMPNGTPTAGWMDVFGFGSGAGADQANRNMFKTIDSPIPPSYRFPEALWSFTWTFYGLRNATSIPEDLFSLIDTSTTSDFSNMFDGTFFYYAYNSTSFTIPAGLFDSLDLSSATGTAMMFADTFRSCAYNSTSATIPSGLFDKVNTTNSLNLGGLFQSTFYQYGYSSLSGSIPNNLFTAINFSSATNINMAFSSTFAYFASANTTPTTDINNIWGSADFAGTISDSNAAGVFGFTFNSMPSLTGSGLTFVATMLPGVTPSTISNAFIGTDVVDI